MKFSGKLIVFIGLTLYFVECVPYKNCGSVKSKVTNVEVSDCDDSKPFCILIRNTNATVGIEFSLISDAENEVKAVCHGIIAGLPVPFKLPNPDGCVDSNISCPLTKGTAYKYVASFPVLKSYPKIRVDVKYELKNGAGEEIACIVIPVKIQ